MISSVTVSYFPRHPAGDFGTHGLTRLGQIASTDVDEDGVLGELGEVLAREHVVRLRR